MTPNSETTNWKNLEFDADTLTLQEITIPLSRENIGWKADFADLLIVGNSERCRLKE